MSTLYPLEPITGTVSPCRWIRKVRARPDALHRCHMKHRSMYRWGDMPREQMQLSADIACESGGPRFLRTDPRMGCRTGLGPDPELSILNVLNQLALS
jgi:hypothetical protein